MANLYKKIYYKLPKFITNDLFFSKKHFVDNSLFFYATAWERNRQKIISDKIFLEIHRLQKSLGIFNNFIDRKLARLQMFFLSRANAKDPIISRNNIFVNNHQGQRCFIVGNGPSLVKQDLSFLAKEFTFVTKAFWQHPILSEAWQPTYYANFHMNHFYDENNELIKPDNPDLAIQLEYFYQVKEKMPKSIYFIPLCGLEANRKYNFLPEDRTYYLPMSPYSILEFLPFCPDVSRGMMGAPDSSQYAIMLAMSMGFKEIILLGCDHTDYMIRGESKHFYEGPVLDNPKENFDSSLHSVLDMNIFNLMVWRGHENLKRMADAHDIRIVNATGGGILDVYPLANYEELTAENHK